MWVVKRRTLREFWERHTDAERALRAWYSRARKASWDSPAEVKDAHANASIIANDRVVFNIKGNAYRLVAHIDYQRHKVYIRFIGTHQEYNGINAEEV